MSPFPLPSLSQRVLLAALTEQRKRQALRLLKPTFGEDDRLGSALRIADLAALTQTIQSAPTKALPVSVVRNLLSANFEF